VLRLSRNTLYYQPVRRRPADLAIMRRIDELHLDYPFAGSRMLRDILWAKASWSAITCRHAYERMGIARSIAGPRTPEGGVWA